jgi:hypothetical protein
MFSRPQLMGLSSQGNLAPLLRGLFYWPHSNARSLHPPSCPGAVCRVIFDKMQGGPTHCIIESHCVVRNSKKLLPKAKSREKAAFASRFLEHNRTYLGASRSLDAKASDGPEDSNYMWRGKGRPGLTRGVGGMERPGREGTPWGASTGLVAALRLSVQCYRQKRGSAPRTQHIAKRTQHLRRRSFQFC